MRPELKASLSSILSVVFEEVYNQLELQNKS